MAKKAKYEIKRIPGGRWGAFDELSKYTHGPAATALNRQELENFLNGKTDKR